QNDPQERYASAAQLLADLRCLHRGQSLRKRDRLKRRVLSASLATGAMLLLAGAVALWREIRPQWTKSTAASGELATPPAGLIAWWPGEGDADDIVGNNHGV